MRAGRGTGLISRYSNILILVGAILAFVPIILVDFVLDSYVRKHDHHHIQHTAQGIADQIRTNAADAAGALRRILADSPSLCTPTFTANVHRELDSRLGLRQVVVENADKVQYCDALGRPAVYSALSGPLPVAGQSETLEIVSFATLSEPLIKLTRATPFRRDVSVFTPVLSQSLATLAEQYYHHAAIRVVLTNGTPILTWGAIEAYDNRTSSSQFISAVAFAGEFPVRVEVAVPFSLARAEYADLDLGFSLGACLLSASVLLFALIYVRRAQMPAFDLERAILRGEIKPFYQPVINTRTGALVGCEVLCRWLKPNGKMIPPNVFIDYAEVTGLAIPMTLSLMEQVKADLGPLARSMPELKISINLFDGHFQDGAIVEDIQTIFGGSPISYRQLVFEITERRPLGDSAQTNAVIAGLHALGARLALDDTGTGHSNLAYLATLGVDVIKIDRVFIDMIRPGLTQVPILDGLIAMAKDLDIEVVAEGVETDIQARYLRARGVYQVQGFLFSPALRAAAFRELAHALNFPAKAADPAPLEAPEAAETDPTPSAETSRAA